MEEKNFKKYWDQIHLKYTSKYDNWLNKYLNLFNKKSIIIELGCGRAYCSKYLLDNNYKNIIACDFSHEVIKIVNDSIPELKTMIFDMGKVFPFNDNSINVIIADLCLHYFDLNTTKIIFNKMYRSLKKDGLLIARVNSDDDNCIPKNSEEIEKSFYYDGKICKRFFSKEDIELLADKFKILNLIQTNMDRYEKEKKVWEFCLKK